MQGENFAQQQAPPAYGHPVTAFAHVFFKIAALVVFIVARLFGSSYILNFVIVVVLLMLDFWVTKNISGRLLVGLRWWNEVTDEGSNWRFETLEEGQRSINSKDSKAFWWPLYAMPLPWIVLGILFFSFKYSLITVLAIVLSGANVVGYTKCSREASAQLRDMAKRAVGAGLTAAMSRV